MHFCSLCLWNQKVIRGNVDTVPYVYSRVWVGKASVRWQTA